MAYKEGAFTLHVREIELKGGEVEHVYFFSRRTPIVGEACDLPEGYDVVTNKQTGLPYLRKKA